MPASQEQLDTLRSVNSSVNAIPYSALPKAGEGTNVWKDIPDGGTWECRDYVVRKKEILESMGWPRADLTVALCYTELNEYHGVLAAEAGGETWILDNRADDIYLWSAPPRPYRWMWRQVAGTDQFDDIQGA